MTSTDKAPPPQVLAEVKAAVDQLNIDLDNHVVAVRVAVDGRDLRQLAVSLDTALNLQEQGLAIAELLGASPIPVRGTQLPTKPGIDNTLPTTTTLPPDDYRAKATAKK